jgi:hypothetical protein
MPEIALAVLAPAMGNKPAQPRTVIAEATPAISKTVKTLPLWATPGRNRWTSVALLQPSAVGTGQQVVSIKFTATFVGFSSWC